MKCIDILFIVNDIFYDYTQDEIVNITDKFGYSCYINIIYSNIQDYRNLILKKYFNFQYIFVFATDYFPQLNSELDILNKIYSDSRVFILCNENYFKLKGKFDIIGSNKVIYFYFKFKIKNILNKYTTLKVDNYKLISTLNGSWNN